MTIEIVDLPILNGYIIIMVIIWLMMVNNNLVGGIPTPLKNMSLSVGICWDNEIPN